MEIEKDEGSSNIIIITKLIILKLNQNSIFVSDEILNGNCSASN